MLVVDLDRLPRRPVHAVQAMPFQRKFAFTVFSGFAAAFAVITLLFAISEDPMSGRSRADVRQVPAMFAQDEFRLITELGKLRSSTQTATSD
jgi:hypothetical protein